MSTASSEASDDGEDECVPLLGVSMARNEVGCETLWTWPLATSSVGDGSFPGNEKVEEDEAADDRELILAAFVVVVVVTVVEEFVDEVEMVFLMPPRAFVRPLAFLMT